MNPLDRFAVIRTPDASQMSGAIHRFYGENRLKVAGKPASFNGHVNYLQLGDLGISFGGFGSDVELYFPNGTDRYAIPICVAGGGELRAGAQTVALDREQTGILTAGRSTSLSFVDAFETTVVQIDAEPLTRKLGGLIGFQPESQLVFAPTLDFRRQTAGFWRRLVQFLISEVDSQGENVDKPGIIELEQTLMVALLRSTPHNFSHLLDGEPHRSAPWQVRRAEEYIEANWHRPITIEALAAATNSSARSLFHSFKKFRGYSPMAFAKQVRLRHARTMLAASIPGMSVTDVAYTCGFSNLGNFAKEYSSHFGERPSETLNAARGISPAR